MFVHIRYFAYISSFIVIIVAVLLGIYFHDEAAKDLTQIVERNNNSLAQGYVNTTWKAHHDSINRLKKFVKTEDWKNYKEFQSFSADTFTHFEGVKVAQLNLYRDADTRFLRLTQSAQNTFGTPDQNDPDEDRNASAVADDNPTREIFGRALNGQTASRIVEDTEFLSPSGEKTRGTLIQTFVPIVPDTVSSVLTSVTPGAEPPADMEAIIEIYYDITPQWAQLKKFQLIVTSGIIFIFVALQGALLFVARKAEGLISTQHEEKVELAATAAKAEAESRQKSQFLANVSHELRTPLNAIIGFSEIIKNQVMGPLQNEQYMNYIADIHSSGVHLLSLINDILDFSKAEAGKLELQLSELDATKLIKNCMRLVSPRAEQAGVELITAVPKEHFVITGDAKKLKQVLLNLLSNSVKFTPQGGNVKVTAWQNVMDDSISIEVKDSGIGISPKDISRAMSPFGQVDSKLSRKYEGTGLGLPLTKKFVEIMGGTFQIESELNVGTTITITIPLTPPRHVMKSNAKPMADGDEKREKQVSPQLMEHAQRAAEADISIPLGAAPEPVKLELTPPLITPAQPASEQYPAPSPSLVGGARPAATPDAPASTGLTAAAPAHQLENRPTLVNQAPHTPADSEDAGMTLAPVRPLTAGTISAAQPPVPPPPPLHEAPALHPAPNLAAPSHTAPAAGSGPVPATSGAHTFTSYDDLKKMMAAQSGNNKKPG